MADLVEKYFQSDLSEAEQEALSRQLLDSEESALKFERLAKEAYGRFGLPEPQPRWKDHPPSAGLDWRYGAELVVVLGVLGGALFGFLHLKNRLLVPEAGAPLRQAPPIVKTNVEKNPSGPPAVSNDERAAGENSARRDGAGAVSHPAASAIPTLSAPSAVSLPAAAGTPINVDLNPSQTFSNLSVVIAQPQTGFLTVWVEDSKGEAVKTLYNGILNPGNWKFEWDGKRSNGLPAQPGFYQIAVRSGASIQRKTVQIQ